MDKTITEAIKAAIRTAVRSSMALWRAAVVAGGVQGCREMNKEERENGEDEVPPGQLFSL